MLPPSVNEFVAEDDPVRLVSEVVDSLNLSGFEDRYRGGGAPAYAPSVLLKVLLFAYSEGLRSSRRIEQALRTDVRYMYLAGMQRPDYRTIARFRCAHEPALRALFVDVVRLCQTMGLVLMRHVSVDGTKIQANVSGRQTYGRERLDKTITAVNEWITRIMEEARATDEAEDAQYGDQRGDALPQELKDAVRRKEKLEAAKRTIVEIGHKAIPATDTDARVMHTTSGSRAAFNAQATVDEANQVIVAAEVTNACCDNLQLRPMIEAAKQNTGVQPDVATADCGYHSVDALAYIHATGLNAYVPVHGRVGRKREDYTYDAARDVYIARTGEELTYRRNVVKARKTYRWYHALRRDGTPFLELFVRVDGEWQELMQRKMESPEGKALYRLRQQIVEPVFGHLKTQYGLRQFLLRGKAGVNCEFLLACMAHNIGKMRKVWVAQGLLGAV